MYGLLQLGVFGFGLLIDGNVGVGVLPAHQEILIGRCGLGSVSRLRVSTAQLQMRHCAYRIADYDPPMVDNLLELRSGFGTSSFSQIGLATHIDGIKRPKERLNTARGAPSS